MPFQFYFFDIFSSRIRWKRSHAYVRVSNRDWILERHFLSRFLGINSSLTRFEFLSGFYTHFSVLQKAIYDLTRVFLFRGFSVRTCEGLWIAWSKGLESFVKLIPKNSISGFFHRHPATSWTSCRDDDPWEAKSVLFIHWILFYFRIQKNHRSYGFTTTILWRYNSPRLDHDYELGKVGLPSSWFMTTISRRY